MKTFRVKTRRSDRVMIVGGGSLGLQLAKALDQVETVSGDAYNVKIIESDLSQLPVLISESFQLRSRTARRYDGRKLVRR